MKLGSLVQSCGILLKGPDRDVPLRIGVDSREVQPGEGFAALRGLHTDGHRFISDVLEKGASTVVCEAARYDEAWGEKFPSVTFILTPDRCEYGLAALGHALISALPSLRSVVAVTGSVGKTSTKNHVAALLEDHFKVHAAERNYNTLIGCAVTVLAAPMDTEILLLEMGANHPGEIAEMVRFFPPTLAAVTEVAPAHLESFKTLEGVLNAKSEIFASKALQCAVVNGDNGMLCRRVEALGLPRVVRFGRKGEVSFAGENVFWKKDHFEVRAILTGLDGLSFNVSLALAGVHQLYPLCCAVAVAGLLGLSSRVIAEDLPKCHSVAGRGELRRSESGAVVIDECYNASPAAVMASLHSMEAAGIPGRRFLVLGEMLELGESAPELHGKVFRKALEVSDNLFLFGAEWRNVQGAEEYCHETLESLIAAVDRQSPGEGDVILVKGSRSNHLERVVRALEL
ncbi:MAG: UDP-N-acetylmuramoyl-tripeptide--D-alanyl-D-alanine ligase [Pyramidobacter sp.]|jgi:UDP-N-acetylmuramoyl-tripeptide--D-alanyl-D-alanine ligase